MPGKNKIVMMCDAGRSASFRIIYCCEHIVTTTMVRTATILTDTHCLTFIWRNRHWRLGHTELDAVMCWQLEPDAPGGGRVLMDGCGIF